MENSHKYFVNTECKYFPCHKTNDTGNFNCMFCFCPFYGMKDCGGNYVYLKKNVKDCSGCLKPHDIGNYGLIIDRLRELVEQAEQADAV